MRMEGRIAQACATDMEALEGQVRAMIDKSSRDIVVDRPDQALTEDSPAVDSAQQVAALQSTVDIHSGVLDRLHMEKAEDVAATTEKLKQLIEAHDTISTAFTDLTAQQAQLEKAVEKLMQRAGSDEQHSAANAAAISCSLDDLGELEVKLLGTLTKVGGQLSERLTLIEDAVAVNDLEEDGGRLDNIRSRRHTISHSNWSAELHCCPEHRYLRCCALSDSEFSTVALSHDSGC